MSCRNQFAGMRQEHLGSRSVAKNTIVHTPRGFRDAGCPTILLVFLEVFNAPGSTLGYLSSRNAQAYTLKIPDMHSHTLW
eukprot:2816675-Rhodomonas_salina.1